MSKYIIVAVSCFFILSCQSGPKGFKTNLKKKSLPNGIEVLSFKDKSLPFFKVMVWSPAGSSYEPKDQGGVTNMASSMLIEGTDKLNKKALSQKFTDLGSSFSGVSGLDSTVFSSGGLTEDSFEIVKLFSEVVLSPKFENKSILDLKNKKMAQIKTMVDSPDSLGSLAFDQTMLKNHGYGRSSMGTLSSLPVLRRAEIVKRYEQIMDTKNLKIIFIGNWAANSEAYLLSRFTDLEKEISDLEFDRVEISEKTKESVFFHKSDLQQANVYMGISAISRASEDYEALKIGLNVLGGSFKSRLNRELRIKRGLTYGVNAGLSAMEDGGLIKISGAVRHDKLYEFITEAKKIIVDTADNGITQEELDKTKAIVRGQFPRAVETKGQEASTYLSLVASGVRGEELYTYLNKVMSLKLVDVNDALRKHLIVNRLNLVVLGNKKKVSKKHVNKLKFKVKSYRQIKM